MTETTKYEKPTITFCDLRLDRAIANPCWSPSMGAGPYYYDVDGKEGTAFVKFYAGSNENGCGAPYAYNCTYHTSKADTAGDAAQGEAYAGTISAAISTSGGGSGQPFKGFTYDGLQEPETDPSITPIPNVS